jgi:dihydrodipicolinate synthase/N-acetylneuraminate lyase
MTEKTLSGVLPVFQTPFNDDETIDFVTLEREIDWLYECGADGVVFAMVSEALRFSTEERRQIVEAVCRFNRDRGVVIISVGAEHTLLAEDYARHAEASGADAVMAIPPVSVAIGEGELLKYYEFILNSTSLPLIAQDASGYVGRPMSVAFQAGLLDAYGADRVLFKPEAVPIGPRLTELRDATHGRATIFEGSGGIALVESYRRGIAGTMPGSDLIKGIIALWNALEAGDEDLTYKLSFPISSLIAMQHGLDGFLVVEKYLLRKQGIFKNELVRGPVGFTMDMETREEIDRLFDRVMIAVEESGTA